MEEVYLTEKRHPFNYHSIGGKSAHLKAFRQRDNHFYSYLQNAFRQVAHWQVRES
jgi:hypothetical protein